MDSITTARRRFNNLYWEHRLGISTRGVVPTDHADSVHYSSLPYGVILPILDHLALRPSDVFVDIGCGKGRVLCCAARRPVGEVVGVDCSAPLCEEARENARRMHGRRAPISVRESEAADLDYSGATVLFLFNPFGAETLASVLQKVRLDAPRRLRIAYAFPKHEEVFQEHSWLTRTGHWDAPDVAHTVSFFAAV